MHFHFNGIKQTRRVSTNLKPLVRLLQSFGLFDVSKPREIPCDNSKDGLEIIFMQEKMLSWSIKVPVRHVRYASHRKPLGQIFKTPILSVAMRLRKMLLKLLPFDIEKARVWQQPMRCPYFLTEQWTGPWCSWYKSFWLVICQQRETRRR